jgi:hypothetical protein
VDDRVEDLGEGEREHREVDRRQSHAEEAVQPGADGGDERGEGEGGQHRQPAALQEQRGPVRSQTERGGMTERHHPAAAHQQLEARGKQREGEHLDEHPHPELRQQRRHDDQQRHERGGDRTRNRERSFGGDAPAGASGLGLGAAEQSPRAHDQHHRHHEERHHE